jgi:Flp pilus assembly protein TadG
MSVLRKVFGRFIKPARRGFVRDERGTTAIEFGILGVPFFALLGATLETAYVFLAGQILDTAVQDAARYIRTGQLQNGTWGGGEAAKFRTEVCDGLYGLFDCTKLWVGVETVSSFTAATVTSPLPTTCTVTLCDWAVPEVYSSGGNSSVILVRVYYKWPTIINLGGFNLANTGANSRLLASVRVFANEPF